MKYPLKSLSVITLGIVAALSCRARQTAPAPASLPTPCIIKDEVQFPLEFEWVKHTTAFRPDGTYTVLSASVSRMSQPYATLAPANGHYTYSVDPKDPTHAEIVYDPDTGSGPTENLYFATARSGYIYPSTVTQEPNSFTLYPAQASSGGVNLSTRTTLTANGHAIVGFVVGGTTPRWVLLRAIGPSLKQFGVPSPVTGTSFTLWNSHNKEIGASHGWAADPNLESGYLAAQELAGAFSLQGQGFTSDIVGNKPTPPADEGVLLLPLKPGAYTMVLSAKSAGNILGEVYFLPF